MNHSLVRPLVLTLLSGCYAGNVQPLTDAERAQVHTAIKDLDTTLSFMKTIAEHVDAKQLYDEDGLTTVEGYAEMLDDLQEVIVTDFAEDRFFSFDPDASTGRYADSIGGQYKSMTDQILISKDFFSLPTTDRNPEFQSLLMHEEAHRYASHSIAYMDSCDWYKSSVYTEAAADAAHEHHDVAAEMTYHTHAAAWMIQYARLEVDAQFHILEGKYDRYTADVIAGKEVHKPEFLETMPPLEVSEIWEYVANDVLYNDDFPHYSQFVQGYYFDRLTVSEEELKGAFIESVWPGLEDEYREKYEGLLSRFEQFESVHTAEHVVERRSVHDRPLRRMPVR